jgi:hypothetical protein
MSLNFYNISMSEIAWWQYLPSQVTRNYFFTEILEYGLDLTINSYSHLANQGNEIIGSPDKSLEFMIISIYDFLLQT